MAVKDTKKNLETIPKAEKKPKSRQKIKSGPKAAV